MYRPPTEATREHWDGLAAGYDELKQRNDVYYSTLKACFMRAVPEAFRGNVLDVGCGTGQVLAALGPKRGVGIDLSEKMIEEARRRFAGHRELAFLAVDARAAGELGPFDCVMSADTMEHVEDWRAVVQAIVHACRAGGLVAISTPSPTWALPLWILEKLKMKMPEGPHKFVSIRHIAAELVAQHCAIQALGTHLLIPARLGGLGPRISAWAQRTPLLRSMGVIQLVTATKAA